MTAGIDDSGVLVPVPRNDMVRDIRQFHEKFRLLGRSVPAPLDPATSSFRIKFMQEELDEYKEAVETGDLAKQFDALIDLVYVALGTSYLQGFPWYEGWAEVQGANMKKELAGDASRSKRGFAGDVVKPPGWTPPDIDGVLKRHLG